MARLITHPTRKLTSSTHTVQHTHTAQHTTAHTLYNAQHYSTHSTTAHTLPYYTLHHHQHPILLQLPTAQAPSLLTQKIHSTIPSLLPHLSLSHSLSPLHHHPLCCLSPSKAYYYYYYYCYCYCQGAIHLCIIKVDCCMSPLTGGIFFTSKQSKHQPAE